MLVATVDTVQFAVSGRSESGSSVIELVPEPLTVKGCALPSHRSVNESVSTSTGSSKSMVMLAPGSTSLALSVGVEPVKAGAESVVNEKVWLALILSGGSSVSVSLIWFASAVTVQLVPSGRLSVGSSVRLELGEPERVNVLELPPQTSVNELVVALTD